jgi:hypothetical protein
MMDSGAFSVWTQGATIPLDKYIEFLIEYREYIWQYVNLDVIPSYTGTGVPPDETERCAKEGWKNHAHMEKAGLSPIPVFHQGERFYWLERMIGEGIEYIGLSPRKRGPESMMPNKIEWLDRVFTYLCGGKPYTKIKTHGFGVSSPKLILRYPWVSVDTTAWIMPSAYGCVFVPTKKEDGYDFFAPPKVIPISRRVGIDLNKLGYGEGRHYDTLGPHEKEWVDTYLKEQGFRIKELHGSRLGRTWVTLRYFKLLNEGLKEPNPFTSYSAAFGARAVESLGSDSYLHDPFRIVMATDDKVMETELLQAEGIRDRLISYFFCENSKTFHLPTYVETGLIREENDEKKGSSGDAEVS